MTPREIDLPWSCHDEHMKIKTELVYAGLAVLFGVAMLVVGVSVWWMGRTIRGTDVTLDVRSHTVPEAAHFVVTNRTNRSRWWCARGVVSGKQTRTRVVSVPVCSGPLEPHTTVTLEAPYAVGAVRELCKGDGFLVDWDKCSFTYEEVE